MVNPKRSTTQNDMSYLDGSNVNPDNVPALPLVNTNLNDFYCSTTKSSWGIVSVDLMECSHLMQHVCQFDCNQGKLNWIYKRMISTILGLCGIAKV